MKKIFSSIALAALVAVALSSCGGGNVFGPLKDYAEKSASADTQKEFEQLKKDLKEQLEGKEFVVSVEDEANAPFSIEKPFKVEEVAENSDWYQPVLYFEGTVIIKDTDAAFAWGGGLNGELYGVCGDNYFYIGDVNDSSNGEYNKETKEFPVSVRIRLYGNHAQVLDDVICKLLPEADKFVLVYTGAENYNDIHQNAEKFREDTRNEISGEED